MKQKPDQTVQLQIMAQRMVDEGVICGVSLGVVSGGDTSLWTYGRQGVVPPYDTGILEAGMYYDLASLSKVIGTTTRILQLIERGKLSLEDKVSGLLPKFAYPDITVEELLFHSSGLPAEIRDKGMWTRKNLLNLLYNTAPELGRNEQFLYSDVGFILLGKIIEVWDKTTLEESYQKNIFAPLGMAHTSFLPPANPMDCVPTECTAERGCICGQVHDKKGWLLGPCGSAGLFSTLEDVTLFVSRYLQRSQLLMGEEIFSLLERKERFGRTLGWSKEYGSHTLYHTGFTGTSILMDLERGIGMVLLSNRIHPTRDNVEFIELRKRLNIEFLKLRSGSDF